MLICSLTIFGFLMPISSYEHFKGEFRHEHIQREVRKLCFRRSSGLLSQIVTQTAVAWRFGAPRSEAVARRWLDYLEVAQCIWLYAEAPYSTLTNGMYVATKSGQFVERKKFIKLLFYFHFIYMIRPPFWKILALWRRIVKYKNQFPVKCIGLKQHLIW